MLTSIWPSHEGTPAERFIEYVDYTYAYTDRAAYEKDALAWRIRREHGFQCDEVDDAELHDAEPNLTPQMRFGVRLPWTCLDSRSG